MRLDNRHKLSTYLLYILFGIMIIGAIAADIQDDLNDLCEVPGAFPYYDNSTGTGNWVCGLMPQPTVTNINQTIIYNGTIGWNKSGTDVYLSETTDNVGIGTNSPTERLTVVESGSTPTSSGLGSDFLGIHGDGNVFTSLKDEISGRTMFFGLSTTGKDGVFGMSTNDNLSFLTNSIRRMTIDESGNIGIGTTTPNRKLDVAGAITLTGSETCNTGEPCIYNSSLSGLVFQAGNGTLWDWLVADSISSAPVFGLLTGTQDVVMGASGSTLTLQGDDTHITTNVNITDNLTVEERVGIGTSTPNAKTEIFSTSSETLLNITRLVNTAGVAPPVVEFTWDEDSGPVGGGQDNSVLARFKLIGNVNSGANNVSIVEIEYEGTSEDNLSYYISTKRSHQSDSKWGIRLEPHSSSWNSPKECYEGTYGIQCHWWDSSNGWTHWEGAINLLPDYAGNDPKIIFSGSQQAGLESAGGGLIELFGNNEVNITSRDDELNIIVDDVYVWTTDNQIIMKIENNTKRVGIGTENPNAQLGILSTGQNVLNFQINASIFANNSVDIFTDVNDDFQIRGHEKATGQTFSINTKPSTPSWILGGLGLGVNNPSTNYILTTNGDINMSEGDVMIEQKLLVGSNDANKFSNSKITMYGSSPSFYMNDTDNLAEYLVGVSAGALQISDRTDSGNNRLLFAYGDITGGGTGYFQINGFRNNVDFQYHGNSTNNNNLIYGDASEGRVGILTNTPSHELNVVGDTNVTGNFTGNFYYGEMWFHNDSATGITHALTQNVWANVTAFNQSTEAGQTLNGFTYTGGSNPYISPQMEGLYKVDYQISFGKAGASAQEFKVAIAVDGTRQDNTEIHRIVGTSGDVGNAGGTGFISLNNGDVITLQIVNIGNNDDAEIHSANINFVRIGG